MTKFISVLTIFLVIGSASFADAAKKSSGWELTEVWAKRIQCEDYLSGSAELKELKRTILQFRTELIRQLITENASASVMSGQHPLCDSICGRVAAKLSPFLIDQGYDVRQVITTRLASSLKEYITMDHTFLVVRIGNREVIVDGAYLSFLGQVGTDFMIDVVRVVFGDILILPYDQLDSWVIELSQLRQSFYSFYEARRTGSLQERKTGLWDASLMFGMTDLDFPKYLKRIWDFKDPIYTIK